MSAVDGCGRPPRRARPVGAGSQRSCGQRGSRSRRCCGGWQIWIRRNRHCARAGCAGIPVEGLERLVDPVTRGDPESPLRWTAKSGAKLAEALRELGHDVVDRTVLRLLKAQGYSLQANKKTREGAQHADRDAQFAHINDTVAAAITAGEPVISVDTKKRELVGDFKAVGREFQPAGKPVEVRGHDFKDKELGHAIPYGVYDLTADEGWVSVGITSDTATFAVNTIISWWQHLGKTRYPHA